MCVHTGLTKLWDCERVCNNWTAQNSERRHLKGICFFLLEVCCSATISCILLKWCCWETYWLWLLRYHFNWLMCEAEAGLWGFSEVVACRGAVLVLPNTSNLSYPGQRPTVGRQCWLCKDLWNKSWYLLSCEIKEKQNNILWERVQTCWQITTVIGCHGKERSNQ